MITVLANGVFDLLHYGHVLHLEAAKKMGDKLIVSITEDEYVNKAGRPIQYSWERSAIVKSLRCVDEVIIVPGLFQALEWSKPDILVKGKDYGKLEPQHEKYCLEHGIKIRFTDTPKFSTTYLINEIRRRS